MFPTSSRPIHLLTTDEADHVVDQLQTDGWSNALASIVALARCTPERALKALTRLADLDQEQVRRIRDSAQWKDLTTEFHTPFWHSWLILAVLAIAVVIGAYALPARSFYGGLIPLLAALLIVRWAWLTRGGAEHVRVVVGGILLVVLSGLVAAALMEEGGAVPPAGLPMILWCLVSLGGGLAFTVWGAVAPLGADDPSAVRTARIGWRLGLVNLAATILLSSLVVYWIGLDGSHEGTEALNALLRFSLFMIVYSAFSAYLFAPLARSGLQAAAALALPIGVGVAKWVGGTDGAAMGYLILLTSIQIATVGLTASGLLVLALTKKDNGQITAALIAAAVAAIGWNILKFIMDHGFATGALETTPVSWLWVGVPALLTAASATVAARRMGW